MFPEWKWWLKSTEGASWLKSTDGKIAWNNIWYNIEFTLLANYWSKYSLGETKSSIEYPEIQISKRFRGRVRNETKLSFSIRFKFMKNVTTNEVAEPISPHLFVLYTLVSWEELLFGEGRVGSTLGGWWCDYSLYICSYNCSGINCLLCRVMCQSNRYVNSLTTQQNQWERSFLIKCILFWVLNLVSCAGRSVNKAISTS